MILNGMRIAAKESMAASLGAGVGVGGIGLLLAGSTAMAVLPIAASAAAGAGIFVASNRAIGFLRAALFNFRIKELEQHAKSLGLNPEAVTVNCGTDQLGGAQFKEDIPIRLSALIGSNDLNVWEVERMGTAGNHYRISREQFDQAKEKITAMAHSKKALPEAASQLSLDGAASLALAGLQKSDRPGHYSPRVLQEIVNSEEENNTPRFRP